MLRFAMIGVTSTGLYFALLIIFESLFSSIILLTALCYGVSMSYNFLAQAIFTFQVEHLSSQQLIRYIVMHGIILFVNSTSMSILVTTLGMQLVIAQILVTGFVTILTFALSKSWVYE